MTEQTKATKVAENTNAQGKDKAEGKVVSTAFYVIGKYLGHEHFMKNNDKTGELIKFSAKAMFLIPTKSNSDGTFSEAEVSQFWATTDKYELEEVSRIADFKKILKFGDDWLLKVVDVSFGKETKKQIVGIATKDQFEAFKQVTF